MKAPKVPTLFRVAVSDIDVPCPPSTLRVWWRSRFAGDPPKVPPGNEVPGVLTPKGTNMTPPTALHIPLTPTTMLAVRLMATHENLEPDAMVAKLIEQHPAVQSILSVLATASPAAPIAPRPSFGRTGVVTPTAAPVTATQAPPTPPPSPACLWSSPPKVPETVHERGTVTRIRDVLDKDGPLSEDELAVKLPDIPTTRIRKTLEAYSGLFKVGIVSEGPLAYNAWSLQILGDPYESAFQFLLNCPTKAIRTDLLRRRLGHDYDNLLPALNRLMAQGKIRASETNQGVTHTRWQITESALEEVRSSVAALVPLAPLPTQQTNHVTVSM